jgi:hypothetical protein
MFEQMARAFEIDAAIKTGIAAACARTVDDGVKLSGAPRHLLTICDIDCAYLVFFAG